MRIALLHTGCLFFVLFSSFAGFNNVDKCSAQDGMRTGKDTVEFALDSEGVELVAEATKASYYHDKFTGRRTASGEIFNNSDYTAAHKTLPFGTKVKVTNLQNMKSVVLTITDRGPFSKGRAIDLTKRAFMEIAHHKGSGVLNVKIERIKEEDG